MKNRAKGIIKALLLGAIMLSTTQVFGAKLSADEKLAKHSLIKSAFRCNISAETIAKSYMYIGEEVGARQARREMKSALSTFSKNHKVLSESINDPKIKNLLVFVKMSYDELEELIRQPYSLDNAQIALDLTATISEGSRHIAETYKKAIGHSDPVSMSGLRPMVESIAKYYIAYQSGIKDDNTIKLMENTVKFCAKLIDVRAKYPENTVAMNQAINKVERLWGVVYKFYLDLDEGGLPFIVFKTTTELKNKLKAYDGLYSKQKRDNIKANK